MNNISYFEPTTTIIPLTITTSTSGFLDTENGTTYSQIIIPTIYKKINFIYNSSLTKWLETYRSTGVTHWIRKKDFIAIKNAFILNLIFLYYVYYNIICQVLQVI